jgi:hypothetical protein
VRHRARGAQGGRPRRHQGACGPREPPTPWIEVGAPLEASGYVYRYGEPGSAGQLFGIE